MSFKVSDIIQPLYQEASQQMATLLLWDAGILWAIDMALCDIYSYEWTNWSFMNKTEEVDFSSDTGIKDFSLSTPIMKVNWIFNIEDSSEPYKIKFNVASSKYHVMTNTTGTINISFNSLEKTIYLDSEAGTKQAVSYLWWYSKPTSKDSVIPLPDAFKAALRDLTLHYILGPQWQYWEQKSWDLHARWMDKLRQLAKSWLWQTSSITFK